MIYQFKDVPGLDSPYLSWENLNCCGGWAFDSSYLHTAVQRGKKLISDITLSYSDEAGELSASETITDIKSKLPDDCILGNVEPFETKNGPYTFLHYFICKAGNLNDYINMDDVLSAYARLGIVISNDKAQQLKELSGNSLETFAKLQVLVNHANPPTGVDLIIAGLILGYPIESTAWLIERDGLLPVA